MATLSALRSAIKTTLQAGIEGPLHIYERLTDVALLPAILVLPAEVDYQTMGRGIDTWTFDLHVLVSTNNPGLRGADLDAYLDSSGARSVRAAIFANRTLGLADVDAHLQGGELGYGGSFDLGEIKHIGARLRLVVHTRGTS